MLAEARANGRDSPSAVERLREQTGGSAQSKRMPGQPVPQSGDRTNQRRKISDIKQCYCIEVHPDSFFQQCSIRPLFEILGPEMANATWADYSTQCFTTSA